MNDFTADTPAPASPPPTASTDETVSERRGAVLSQLAKPEDVTEYARERVDQVEAIDRGEDIPQERQSAWLRRASKALQDAALEAQGIQPNGQQEQQEPPGI